MAGFPVILLGAAAILLVRWLAPESGDSFPADTFVPMFLALAALALLVAGSLAYVFDRALRDQIGLVVRTLASGRIGDLRGLAAGRGWGGLAELSREAQDALGRSQEGLRGAFELKAFQAAADDLLGKLREWAETEIPPPLVPDGPLSEIVSALLLLAQHLEERAREAHEVTEMTRDSLAEACESIERATRDAERGAREVSGLVTALGEVRRLGAEVSGSLQQGEEGAAALPYEEPGEWLGPALGGLDEAIEGTDRAEKRSLRAALEIAALALARRDEGALDAWLAVVGELKESAVEARAALDRLSALRLLLLHLKERERGSPELERIFPRARTGQGEPTPASEQAVEALADRLANWSHDALGRAERLAAIVQRFSSLNEAALAATRAGAQEVGGLLHRFDSRSAGPAEPAGEASGGVETGASDPESGTSRSVARGSMPRPLRLLTREDVVPDDAEGIEGGEPPRS